LQAEFTKNLNETIRETIEDRRPYRSRNKQGSRRRKIRIPRKRRSGAIYVDLREQFPVF
jgi:hypothetical protein